MTVDVKLASTEHKPHLKSLLTEYLSELSGYGEVDYAYPYFEAYWEEVETRWPYLVLRADQCVGFAFVNKWSPSGRGTDYSMAEFYIIPDARGCAIGRDAAKAVLQAHSGQWELSVMRQNAPAHKFWPSAIKAAEAEDLVQIASGAGTIYRFAIYR